jgi:RNA polymerase sigma-70 factor (ECF subfamily)
MKTRFLEQIEEHTGIINKIVNLYADNSDDRQDLRQEILLQAWRSYESFENRSKFSTWLYRVCLNTALVFHRKSKRMVTVDIDDIKPLSNNNEVHHGAELLYLAVKQLPPAERSIIILHLDGYANEEIAEIIGISKNNAAVKLHRIKQTLTEKVRNEANRV